MSSITCELAAHINPSRHRSNLRVIRVDPVEGDLVGGAEHVEQHILDLAVLLLVKVLVRQHGHRAERDDLSAGIVLVEAANLRRWGGGGEGEGEDEGANVILKTGPGGGERRW